jgi:aminopeptidase YwaD
MPTPTPTEVLPGPEEIDAERIIEHVRVLSEEIGPRLSGSPAETQAADYARGMLESWGYDVELQEFSSGSPEFGRFAEIRIDGSTILPSIAFIGSGTGSVRGRLVDAGTGRVEDFPVDTDGAIVLIQREDVFFTDMAQRAVERGAAGVIVANNAPSLFRGELDPPSSLPVASLTQDDGVELRDMLAEGPVDVEVDIPVTINGTNVIARAPGGSCRTVSGGHYDTVPWAPGATDNASGSAVVLELARAVAAAGNAGHCFALWSGEEEGLIGSAHFVDQLSIDERRALEAYYNYDVVAGALPINALGSQSLIEAATAVGSQLGFRIESAALPQGQSSDFASFQAIGIPTLMFIVDDMGVLHTEQDTFANMRQEPLEPIARIGLALLQAAQTPAGARGLPASPF